MKILKFIILLLFCPSFVLAMSLNPQEYANLALYSSALTASTSDFESAKGLCQSFISLNADINAINKNTNQTCLNALLLHFNKEQSLEAQEKLISLFVSLGANTNKVDDNGNAPLHLIARPANCYFSVLIDDKKSLELFSNLIKLGAELTVENSKGKSAFELAKLRWKNILKEKPEVLKAYKKNKSAIDVALKSRTQLIPDLINLIEKYLTKD